MSIIETKISEQGVGQIILNQPEKRNAFNSEMIAALQREFKAFDHNDDVRLIELSGVGAHFCAGADLAWMQASANYSYDDNLADANRLAEMLHTIKTVKKPTLAAVQGACFGGGLGLVACCDIAIGSESALFCLSEVKLGLIPAVISPYVMSAIGRRQAMRYMYSAEVISAILAFELGLLHEVFPDGEFAQQRQEFIDMLLANGPQALQALKTLVTQMDSITAVDEKIQNITAEAIAQVRSSNEGQEGIAAFLEKRQPAWKS